MKIGVTSQNFRTITGHAGKTRRFLIYEATDANSVKEVDRLNLPKEMAMHSYRAAEPHPIAVVDVLITGGCGEGFFRRMDSMGVQVIATAEKDPLRAIQAVIAGEALPPPEPHDH